jgi:hypothetical protein
MYKDYDITSTLTGSTTGKNMVVGQNNVWFTSAAPPGISFSYSVANASAGSKWYTLDVIYQDGGPL